MARSRNIKPGFFTNEHLADLPFECRLLFIGLWTLADREGRLEDRPKRIKAAIFPYNDVDVDASLRELEENEEVFIVRYEVDGSNYIQINNFVKHQSPHHKEVASTIPAIPRKRRVISQASPNSETSIGDERHKHEPSMSQAHPNKSASSPLIPDSLNPLTDSLNPLTDSLLLIPDCGVHEPTTDEGGKPPKDKHIRFSIPPTVDDVEKYCLERKNGISPNKFIDHYTARGWKVGKTKMVDWQAAVRTWEDEKACPSTKPDEKPRKVRQ